MSLIGEALKRARLEAARREGEERGTAHSSVPAYLPARRRSRAGVLAATVVAALVGAGAVYWLLRPSSTPAVSARPPFPGKEETPAASDLIPGAVTSPSAAAPSSTAVSAQASSAPPAAPSPESVTAAPPAPAAAPVSPPAARASLSPAPASAAAPLAADAIPPGARVFVSVAQLGPTRLELDGIVASPTDPVAMINRRLLGVGEGLDGWVVEKIEAKQVTLRGGRETIVLRLR